MSRISLSPHAGLSAVFLRRLSVAFACAFMVAATSVCADVLVPSWDTGKIYRFQEGTNVPIGELASGLASLENVAYGPDGKIYFAEYWEQRIRRCNVDGSNIEFVCSVDGNPVFVLFDSAGNLYVSAGKLIKYSPSRQLLGQIGPNGVGQARFGPDGYIYAAANGKVIRFLPDGTNSQDVFTISNIRSLDVAPNGEIYVTGDATGGTIHRWNSVNGLRPFANVHNPAGIQFDSNGDLICGTWSYERVIYRIRPDGSFDTVPVPGVTAWPGTSTTLAPAAVMVGSGSHVVQSYDSFGHDLGNFIPNGAGGLNAPYGMRFGPDRNLYVADLGADKVKKYDGWTGQFLGDFASSLNNPADVEFDAGGNVYVGMFGAVRAYRPNGTLFGEWPFGGYVEGLKFHTDGKLLASNSTGSEGGTIALLDTLTGDKAIFSPDVGGQPIGIERGPDGRYYVAAYSPNVRVIGANGGPASTFANGLTGVNKIAFADGRMFVTNYSTKVTIHDQNSGQKTGEFLTSVPIAIASRSFKPTDTLFIASESSRRIDEFTKWGDKLKQFTNENLGSRPQGVTFGPDGNLYVCRTDTSSIDIHDPRTGAYLRQFASVAGAVDILFDFNGFAYVSSGASVVKIDSAGTIVGSFSTDGGLAECLDFDGNRTLIVPLRDRFIKYLDIITGTGGRLDLGNDAVLSGVTHAPDGRSFFTIKKPTGAGIYLYVNGGMTRFDSGIAMNEPYHLKYIDGVLYASDRILNKVFKYDGNSGEYIGSIAVDSPSGIAVRSTVAPGTLIVTDNIGQSVRRFSTNGENLGILSTNGIANPVGVERDKAGNIYIANYGSQNVNKYSAEGTFLGVFATVPSGQNPWGLAFDSSGNLYVAVVAGGTVLKYAPDGTSLGAFISGISDPNDVAIDSSGNVYVSTNAQGVRKFSPSGASLGQFAPVNGNGLAFDPLGNLYIAQINGGQVRKLSPTGVDLGAFFSGPNGPIDITFDAQGVAYIANYGFGSGGSVSKVSPTGQLLSTISAPGFSGAGGIVFIPQAQPSIDPTPFDLSISNSDLSFNPDSPVPSGASVAISAIVHNNSDFDGTATVRFYRDSIASGNLIGEQTGLTAAKHSATTAGVTWDTTGLEGSYTVIARIEDVSPVESSSANNTATRSSFQVVKLPDLQVPAASAPEVVWADAAFDVSWTDKNAGQGAAAAPWKDRIFLSSDDQLGGDTQLGEFELTQSLTPGSEANRIQAVTISRSLVSQGGDFYLIVQTDAANGVNEGANEGNNWRAIPITVNVTPQPDLTVESVQAPDSAFFDQTIIVSWKVKNLGPGTTDASEWYDRIFLSLDTDPSGDDLVQLDVQNVSYLNAGEGYNSLAEVKIPKGLSGPYFLVVKTDRGNAVTELVESNNFASRPIDIRIPPLPDLQTPLVQATDAGYAGEPISINWRVENRGDTATPPTETSWSDGVYISKDATFNPGNARFLGSKSRTGSLAAGAGYDVQGFAVNLPNDVSGDWYVYVAADVNNQVYEYVKENNNVGRAAGILHITSTPPDLIVRIDESPAQIEAGKPFSLKYTVTNQGAFEAKASWWDTIYISTSATPDPATATALVSLQRTANLGPGLSYQRTEIMTLPPCTTGSYYFFVYTDSRKELFEFDPNGDAEANNISVPKPATVTATPPDLQVTTVTAPNMGEAGKAIAMSWTVTNAGTGSTVANSWTDRIYLSRNSTFDNTAQGIGSSTRNGELAAGANYTVNADVTLPASASGTYYIFVKTDSSDAVEECDKEDNNVGSTSVSIEVTNNDPPSTYPDLQISSMDAPSNAFAGDSLLISWQGANGGEADAKPAWSDRVYLSNTSAIDGSARLLASTLVVGPVAPGGMYAAQASVVIPIVPAGGYFLIVAADGGGNINEGGNEGNNTASTSIAIQIPDNDLRVTALDVPAEAFSGQEMNVAWTVTNAGSARTSVAGWTDYLFLSKDSILDPTDKSIGWATHVGKLDGGASYNASVVAAIPAGITGPYNVFVLTDYGQQVPETNELNNLGGPATVMLLLPPPVDLTPTSITLPPNGSPGETATIGWSVKNVGQNTATGRWTDTLYLSKDKNWDIDDVVIGRRDQEGPLAAAASYSAELVTELPAIEEGNYYVLVRTDVRNKVREDDETNNTLSSVTAMPVLIVELKLGIALNTDLRTGKERYQKVINAPAGETVLYSLDASDPSSSTELYARYGKIASRGGYDYQFSRPWEPDQEIVVPDTIAGHYYSMIRGALMPAGPTPVTLTAKKLPFSIRGFTPAKVGDNGQVTLTLHGAKYSNATLVTLVKGSTVLTPAKIWAVDKATLKARFQFQNAPRGDYSVKATNPGPLNTTAPQLLTIEAATAMGVNVDTNGNLFPRVGRPMNTSALVTNAGNIDAPYVTVLTRFTGAVVMGIRRPSTTVPYQNSLPGEDWAKASPTARDDGVTTRDVFIIRDLAPGETVNFSANVTGFAAGDFRVAVQASPEAVGSFVTNLKGSTEDLRQMLLLHPEIELSPEEAAALGNAENWWQLKRQEYISLGYIDSDSAGTFSIQGLDCCARQLRACLEGARMRWEQCRAGAGLVDRIRCNMQYTNDQQTCGRENVICIGAGGCDDDPPITPPNCPEGGTGTWGPNIIIMPDGSYTWEVLGCGTAVRPNDPNHVEGPVASGVQEFTGTQSPWPYTIYFENVPTASASAQRVTIVEQLDPSLDSRTFRLKEIGFGAYKVPVPDNRAFYQTRIQLGADLGNILCDISAGLDIMTGQVRWTLTAIDPNTGEQPSSGLLGILPPNNDSGVGQGYVKYEIMPMTGAGTGTVISAQATITFDVEQPILTNTATNAVEAHAPSSAVKALPPISPETFNVIWLGMDDDGGAGISHFDVWVKDNDGPYMPLLTSTNLSSKSFTGVPGHTYRFYSIAVDGAGNVEAAPTVPDATTAVGGNPVPSLLSVSPNKVAVGGPAFVLTVTGSGFTPASVVKWKGSNRTTTLVSPTELRANITAADIASVSTAAVTVVNPSPGGGTSNTINVSVVTWLASITLSPTSLYGGASSTGTVTLSLPAAAGGTEVALSSNLSAATVPQSIAVPEGATTTTFTISTVPVTALTKPVISATLGTTKKTATLTIKTPILASLVLSPNSIYGGAVSNATITLTGAAPSGGISVTVTSSDASAVVPSPVVIPAGATSVPIVVTTSPVAVKKTVTISATYAGLTKSATLTLKQPVPLSVTLNPTSVQGGNSSTATLKLSGKAPAGGLQVTLISSNVKATVPPNITVPAGSDTVDFTVNTVAVTASTTATITANANAVSKSAKLTITK